MPVVGLVLYALATSGFFGNGATSKFIDTFRYLPDSFGDYVYAGLNGFSGEHNIDLNFQWTGFESNVSEAEACGNGVLHGFGESVSFGFYSGDERKFTTTTYDSCIYYGCYSVGFAGGMVITGEAIGVALRGVGFMVKVVSAPALKFIMTNPVTRRAATAVMESNKFKKFRELIGRATGGRAASIDSEAGSVASKMTKAEIIAANRAAGLAAEKLAAEQLVAEGNAILGSHVSVRTPLGLRVIDHLIKTPSGQIMAVEVKHGNGVRSLMQVMKDQIIGTSGGIMVGKNAPAGLRGQHVIIQTVERIIK